MEGEEYELNPLDAIVMDYARIHEVIYALPQTMGICIHVSRQLLRRYLPEAEPFAIRCAGQRLLPGQQEYYNEICGYLKELTVLYVNQNENIPVKKHGADSGTAGMSGGTFFRTGLPGGNADEGGQYGAAGADLYVCGSSLPGRNDAAGSSGVKFGGSD